MFQRLSAVIVLALFFSVTAIAAPAITLDIPHPLTSAPGDFRARIAIEPAPTNRFGCLHVVPRTSGDEITRCWSLNGEQEPKTFWQNILHLPVGRYDVTASVIDNKDHSTLSPAVQLIVFGPGYDPEPSEP